MISVTTLLTPKHIEHLRLFLLEEKNTTFKVFIGSSQIDKIPLLKEMIPNVDIQVLPPGKTNFSELIGDFRKTRSLIKRYKRLVEYHFGQLKDGHIRYITFSDKNPFDQIWITKINNYYRGEILAIDEGLGFYSEKLAIDNFRDIIYRILSPILFGVQLRYKRVLGRDRRISKIYLRYPNLFPNEYKKPVFPLFLNNDLIKYNRVQSSLSNKALLFTSVLSEQGLLTKKNEYRLISSICKLLSDSDYSVHIKPHPREENIEDKYTDIDTLKSIYSAEDRIEYNEYKLFIHFNSSVIFDLIDFGIPKSNIITLISQASYKRVSHIVNKSKVVSYTSLSKTKKLINHLESQIKN